VHDRALVILREQVAKAMLEFEQSLSRVPILQSQPAKTQQSGGVPKAHGSVGPKHHDGLGQTNGGIGQANGGVGQVNRGVGQAI